MRFILGPAVCKVCRLHVYWDGIAWCAPSGLEHACRGPQKPTSLRRWLKRVTVVKWGQAA